MLYTGKCKANCALRFERASIENYDAVRWKQTTERRGDFDTSVETQDEEFSDKWGDQC